MSNAEEIESNINIKDSANILARIYDDDLNKKISEAKPKKDFIEYDFKYLTNFDYESSLKSAVDESYHSNLQKLLDNNINREGLEEKLFRSSDKLEMENFFKEAVMMIFSEYFKKYNFKKYEVLDIYLEGVYCHVSYRIFL